MRDFQSQYGSEEQCESALFASRWPQGWHCARCNCSRSCPTRNRSGRQLRECLICGYQSSSIVGTVFEHTKLPLSVWFLAMYLMTQSKNSVSALELKRQLGVTYKTAWLLKHKLLQTMLLREEPAAGMLAWRSMMPIWVVNVQATFMAVEGPSKSRPSWLRCKRIWTASRALCA